jgi:hypothetical protein
MGRRSDHTREEPKALFVAEGLGSSAPRVSEAKL